MRLGKELLHVKSLSVSHIEKRGSTKIVDHVDLKIHEGETVGLIGPTGTGKTIAAKAIMGILQPVGKPDWMIEGEVLYRGRDLTKLSEEELRELRGNELSIIFQKPASSMNPMLMIGSQTGEPVEAHEDIETQRLRELVLDYLGKVELPDAKRRYRFYRHQFSGGEAQRIMIAMALICRPSFLIADEPTSDLDVTVQRQVLELLKRVKEEFGLVDPIIARREDRTVIGGHQRLLAARRLGLDTVPVVFVDLSREQARLLNLALNRISGDWDQELLARLLADLQDEYGFPTWGLGIIAGIAFLTGFAGHLTLGPLADRGHVHGMLTGGIVAGLASLLWLAAATELWQFVAARAVFGLAEGAFLPAARRLVLTWSPDRPGAELGRLLGAGMTGFVGGPIVGGLLAQGLSLYDAAALGVYLHGKAGEVIRDLIGDTGMLASDLLPVLPLVIKQLRETGKNR